MAGSYTRRINLYINGKEVKNNLASIRAEMNKVVNEQSRMTRGTREYVEAGKKIRILKGIIQEHNDQLQATSKSWSFANLSHEMNKHYLAVTTFLAAFAGILYSGKQAISMFAEFDDKVSDVMKTTDLSKETVYALNEELKKIDTRTAQLELLDLGRIAGKLNIKTKEDVEGFIRASDKVVVALKEDLGGSAEEAVRQIGKLVSVFGIKERFGIEDAITKTGSALNELGMASTASEAYIVSFTKRVAGVAPTARISLQDVMGLAATLDHLGQTSEVSSTAYSQVVTGMFKDTEAYARAARMSVESFSSLLKKDANEAFLKLLEGLHNNDAGMEELIKSMGDLDLEGKRAISVIGVLSNNTKLLREQQKISNREFAKGTSLQQEFNVKNNNAQAILEKKRKILSNLAIDLGQKLMPVLTVSTSGFTYFVKAVSVLTDFTIRNSGAILRLTASIAAYTIATKLTTLWVNRQTQATLAQIIVTKARAFAEGASIAITQLYAAATMLLSGNVKGATQAVRAFNTVIKVSPIGILAGLLTLAVGAMITFWNRTEEVVTQGVSLTKEIIRLQKEKTEHIVREKNELNGLVSQIMLTNENSAVRKELINQLQTLYPDFLKNLDAEKVTNQQLAGQLGIVNAKYREKARIAALSAKSEAITKKMTDNESSIIEAQDYLKTHRTPNLDPRSPEAMEIQANINAVKRLTRENENYLVVLNDLDKRIVDLKDQNNSNSEDWWTKKIVELTWAIAETKRLIGVAQKNNDYLSFQNLTLDLEDYNKQLQAASQNLQNIQKGKPEGTKPASSDPFNPTQLSDDSKKTTPKWSLNNDIGFLRESLKLKQDYGKGIIQTEEELNNQLRELEIRFMKQRIKSGKESGEALLDIQQQLADKYIEKRKDREKREDDLEDVITKGMSPVEREKQEYEERIIELKLFGKARGNMTEIELCALEALEKEHLQKLSKLDAEAMKEEIERRQQTFEIELAQLRLKNTNEYNSINSYAEAIQKLSATMSAADLKKIRTIDQAKKIILKQNQKEEEELARKHLEEMMTILQTVMSSGEWEGLNLSDKMLSEEEKQVLLDRIKELSEALAKLKGGGEIDVDKVGNTKESKGADILGFSQDDWDAFNENLKNGKFGVNDMILAVSALKNVFQSYYESVSKSEQARLEQFEASVNSQTDTLRSSLDGNLISQEAYNYQVKQLEDELNRRKSELERKNAIRARNIALMEAIVNTASAITSALKIPVLGIALAAIVGALGAFQISKIVSTPLPGKEEGGFLDVERTQDGKHFKAKNDPGKRGYVSTPTVITGEKPGSKEYIVPDEGVNNPTISPVLDMLEMARQNGNLATINLPAIMESTRTYPGRQQGGYISDITGKTSGKYQASATPVQDSILLETLRQNTMVMQALKARLNEPIESTVALHGRKGLYELMNEDEILKNNANL